MDKKPIFTVTSEDAGQRLDNFLFKQRKHLERNQWYKLIRKGQVRVNGKRVKPLHKLGTGDLVRIPPADFFVDIPKVKIDDQQVDKLWQAIIFENQDFLVFNKPAGMPCHVGTGHDYGLIELVKSKSAYQNILLAHRLDKDTSGCVVLAKNRQALLQFQEAMKQQQLTKKYLTVLEGKLEQQTSVNQPLDIENRVNGIRTVVVSPQGKAAETIFTPLKSNNKYTLAACQIKTGRTHQIRVHAQFMGFPVLGDQLYGNSKTQLKRKLYLHAESLTYLTHQWQADTPKAFARIMA